ncbi:efflux RND transporter periplasmic adaptor subunit, partial [Acidobacteria bacterium AH-259-G07]|nr:efflux RND transporter periplasmic adaptor subunit [Acidobacteria bacterium AH-259-G07]
MEKDLRALRIDRKKEQLSSGMDVIWRILFSILLVAALLAAAYFSFFRDNAEKSERLTAEVASNLPEISDDALSSDVLIASGYVVAHHKISVGSKVMGKVAWVGVEKGDRVRMGQLLVKLDDREYVARLNEAIAAQGAAEARLTELEAGSRPQEIQRAEAELQRAKTELENARLEWERFQKLLESGIVSQQQIDDARSRKDTYQAAVRVAQKNYELLKLGPRSEQIAHGRAEVERARASVDYARALLEATEIRAPISGTVLERIVETGEMVTTSFAGERGAKSSVVALADLNDIQVELDISQSDFNRISRDQNCRMTPEAYPDREYRCEIAEISPEANRQKATIQVKVQILEPDEFLR